MDRRTLLAFALATVVLIGWSLFFPTTRETPRHEAADSVDHWETGGAGGTGTKSALPVEPGSARTEAGETAGRGTPKAEELGTDAQSAGGPAWLAPGGAAPGDEAAGTDSAVAAAGDTVVVETDLYHARIHTIGGGLVGFTLKKYLKGDRSGPVDLVRPGAEALDLGVEWGTDATSGEMRARGEALPLGDARFAVVREPLATSEGRGERILLTATRTDGVVVRREYRFRDGTYEISHRAEVNGLPVSDRAPELVVGWRAGMPFTESAKEADEQQFSAIVRAGDEIHSWNPGKFKNGPRFATGAVRWAAVANKYFVAALVPAPGTATQTGAMGDPTSFRNAVWVVLPAPAADRAVADLRLYLGPKDLDQLRAVDPGLVDAVNLGYRWMRPITRLMVRVLKATYNLVPNYGWVIIILSLLVRVILFPLNQTSMRSMKAMQRVQPEMEAIRKKYADKPQEMNKQVMLLYQKHKVNPLGGCLPILVQMPVLFALYFSLMSAIDLRMAPFVGWIHDLSAPDTVGHIGGFPIHVLPLIMTAVSVVQARSTPTDPRQAMMTTLMPIMFLVFFYNMPSGLVLYWTVTNLGTWIQQLWVNRLEHRAGAASLAPEELATTAQEAESEGIAPETAESMSARPKASGVSAGRGGVARRGAAGRHQSGQPATTNGPRGSGIVPGADGRGNEPGRPGKRTPGRG
jgi:YidC/Oxa1 family membrane protein insertase